jgi:transcriptional regulator with XRE-family HTH domain
MRWEEVVGRNVKNLRKARGLTQEALAHAAEIDARYIGGIERGEENPTVAVLARIASALDIEPAAFFAGPSSPVTTLAKPKGARPLQKSRRSRSQQS